MGYNIIDKYSLLHFLSGILAYYLGISFYLWFLLHFLFEIIENSQYGMKIIKNIHFWPGGKVMSDNLLNSSSDQLFAIFGWLFSYYMNK